jgi:hypothetical protein
MPIPFVGEQYSNPDNMFGGARIMILGEAHYSKDYPIGADVPEMTQGVIQMHLSGHLGRNSLFFKRVERLMTGSWRNESGEFDKAAFWQSVIFQNYVPVIAGTKPRDRPATWMWAGRAEEEYRANVKKHEVEIVLVCGTELWRKKPFDVAQAGAYAAAGRTFEAHELNYADQYGAIAAHIPHPSGSRGWTYDRCDPVARHLLSSINKRRQVLDVRLASSPVFE